MNNFSKKTIQPAFNLDVKLQKKWIKKTKNLTHTSAHQQLKKADSKESTFSNPVPEPFIPG